MAGKKKPPELKVVDGTFRPDRDFGDTPEPPRAENRPPPLFLDDDATAEWERIAPELEDIGILAEIDETALAAYCVAVSRWKRAEKDIEENGITVDSQTGTKKNPSCTVANEALAQMRAFGSEFGLTPASRSRISVGLSGQKKPRNAQEAAAGRIFD